jgi:hypothetical protein
MECYANRHTSLVQVECPEKGKGVSGVTVYKED